MKNSTIKTVLFGLSLFIIGLLAGVSFYQNNQFSGEAFAADSRFSRTKSFVEIARKETLAVVNISTKQTEKVRNPSFGDQRTREFYERFFPGFRDGPRERVRQSLGSGFVVEKDGYILTNSHVVGKADEIIVTFGDGNGKSDKEYPAKLIGSDPKTDIALIKIEADKPLPVLKLGDSDALEVGEWVMAIGNPFGFSQSVTVGVVSAKGRVIGAGPYDDFIQTDASINPGNSGGPLLNTRGEAIGINTAIFTGGTQGNIGIGFAVPINVVKLIYDDLKKGKVSRGWLGVAIQPITPEIKEALDLPSQKGALISQVFEDSPAKNAGLKRYDVILSFDGNHIPSSDALPKVVGSRKPGKKVKIILMRDGKKKTITMKLGEMPTDPNAVVQEENISDNFGLTVEEVTQEIARRLDTEPGVGMVITMVERQSVAAQAGLRGSDLIMEIDRSPVNDVESYNVALSGVSPGEVVLMVIKRGQNIFYITITAPR